MPVKILMRCLLIVAAALAVSLPSQAAMVGTAQLQAGQLQLDLAGIGAKREWIETQLVGAGVETTDANLRVAAMTDAQVLQLHQRIDQQPAGGNTALVIILILLFTELMGYTDILPFIRPVE